MHIFTLVAQDTFKIPDTSSNQNVQHLKHNWNVQHLKESWTMNIHWTLNDCTDCSVWQSQRKLRGFEAEQLKSNTADYTVTQWVLFRVPGSPWGPERGFGSLFGLLFMFRVPFFSILDYRMQRIAARIIVDRILKGHCKNCTPSTNLSCKPLCIVFWVTLHSVHFKYFQIYYHEFQDF